ncbi:unnamed protein product [Closterium sp. NIES-64]|nr:unnamed protein product [Closterium sp. NIES-64]
MLFRTDSQHTAVGQAVMPHAKAVRLSPVKPPACPKGKSWSAGVQACVSTCRDVRDCKKTSGYCVNGMCLCKTGLVMLPDETCALPCDRNECGSDAVCYKNAKGSNTCACNSGYTMTPLGCKEPCTVTKCGANAFCYKNAERNDTCGCNDGFTMTSNGRCIDSCLMQNCGPNATCVKGTGDQAWCICKQGFRNVSGKCIGTSSPMLSLRPTPLTRPIPQCLSIAASCASPFLPSPPPLRAMRYSCLMQNCGPNATCVKGTGDQAWCICKQGYKNVSGRCIDECDLCGPNATCDTDQQSGAKTCRCNNGYYMLPDNTCAGASMWLIRFALFPILALRLTTPHSRLPLPS